MGQLQYANQNWNTVIQGVSPDYLPITNWHIAAGRGLTDADDTNAALVVAIGQTVYHQLFGASDNPIGATILVKGVPMRWWACSPRRAKARSGRTRMISS